MNKIQPSNIKIQGKLTIGHYCLGPKIGEGAFGKVRQAIHSLTNDKVAIKILKLTKISDSLEIERITREMYILKLVRHPNIIQLYEIINSTSRIYLSMEYVSGGDLQEYITRNTRLTENEACRLFQQIISAISYLHRINVAHRDLKPKNLLLDHNKNIKLIDFGLSNTYNPHAFLETACGSPSYTAPEIISGLKYAPLPADIWSAGIILYFMVSGRLPFEEPNTSLLYNKIIAGEFRACEKVSDLCNDLLKKILIVDPKSRLKIEEIVKHKWFSKNKVFKEEGVLMGYDPIEIDKGIVDQLRTLNFNPSIIEEALKKCIYDSNTAIYYLLLKKNCKHSQESVYMDIENPINFSKPTFSFSVNKRMLRNYENSSQKGITTETRRFIHHRRSITDQGSNLLNASRKILITSRVAFKNKSFDMNEANGNFFELNRVLKIIDKQTRKPSGSINKVELALVSESIYKTIC